MKTLFQAYGFSLSVRESLLSRNGPTSTRLPNMEEQYGPPLYLHDKKVNVN